MNGSETKAGVQTEARLWLAQRVSAMVLGIAVVVHLGVIIMAVRGGLSAAEIVERVAGNIGWTVFYTVFLLAVAVHAPIGLRAVLSEMTKLSPKRVDLLCFIAAVFLVVMGMRTILDFYQMGAGS
jgi:fumarate reductase subunit C